VNKLVSIITPSYNSVRYLEKSICSVLDQTYIDFELIVVDDFSRDKSNKIINKYAQRDHRIKPIYLKSNIGAAMARNIALSRAKGRYIAFLDADDCWHSHKLSRQLEFMQQNNYAFTFTSYNRISEDGTQLSIVRVPNKITYSNYLKNTLIGCLTVMIDRKQTDYFEMQNIRSSHDMVLWLQIMKKGFIAYGLDEVLASYRVLSSSNTSNKLKSAIDVWYVYRNIEKLNFFLCIWCFINYAYNAIKRRIR
jgi:teichuronic acid biosynthesis glycosyltransferase TuaG